MKTILQHIRAYLATRDSSSWFLVTAGAGLIATLAESIRLHREVGPHGVGHGDVAGGFLLFEFLFSMVPFVLAFAVVGALSSKSTAPFIGAISGWIAVFPMLLVSGILGVFLGYVSPLVGGMFPFAAGIAFVVTGLLKKAKAIETSAREL